MAGFLGNDPAAGRIVSEASAKFRKGDSVLVIGVGRSGLATAEVLRKKRIAVVAYDDKPHDQLVAERQTLLNLGVPLIGAAELAGAAAAAKAAVISPGVPLTNAAVRQVQDAGVPVFSEIEVAYQLTAAPIIAVTGSKGKSTTTALIGHLLRCAGKHARVGGNIGNPLIRETAAADSDDWIVAEVSSFQLEGIRAFAPRISVLLNISPDHLDRYPSMEEYAEAKYRIFANQKSDDVFVGNADDPYCAGLRQGHPRPLTCKSLWFGLDANNAQLSATLVNGSLAVRVNARLVPLIAVEALGLRGQHNVQNALAAALAALSAGVNVAALREGLASFEPLPHRLTTIHEQDGVAWVDDSKATNPDAAVKALEAFDGPIILIAGGKSKRTDFSSFAQAAGQRAKLVILIGEAAHEIGAQISGAAVIFAASLADAVEAAARAAVPGDVVLLSPACASFDMFQSAEQRGAMFAELAQNHGKQSGRAVS